MCGLEVCICGLRMVRKSRMRCHVRESSQLNALARMWQPLGIVSRTRPQLAETRGAIVNYETMDTELVFCSLAMKLLKRGSVGNLNKVGSPSPVRVLYEYS